MSRAKGDTMVSCYQIQDLGITYAYMSTSLWRLERLGEGCGGADSPNQDHKDGYFGRNS